MSITLELAPEVEQALHARAEAQGVSIAALVEELVSREVARKKAQNLDELFAPVRGLFREGELSFEREPASDRDAKLL
ncbi:MAG: hypothetical protein JST65_13940 [Acidobacteria bacterium]|nr:hypothetical protein [Acidobacteriota bacterium]